MTETPSSPPGTRAGGKRLWNSVVQRFELDEHELALLTEAVRTIDVLDRLDTMVRRDGVLVDGRAHPALVEARQQRITLARLLAVLRLPAGEVGQEQATARPQRRAGARGVYGITGLAG